MKIRNKYFLVMLSVTAILVSGVSGMPVSAKKPVKLNVKKITLKVKKTKKLKIKGIKKSKIKKVRWSSTKKRVAKVTSKGKVKALKAGTATVKCRVYLKNGKKYRLSCKVKVKKKKASKKPSHVSNHVPKHTSCPVPTGSVVPIKTSTPAPTGTSTPAPTGTSTPVPTGTSTPVPTGTKTPAPTGTKTPAPSRAEHQSANGITTLDTGLMRSDLTAFDVVHEMGLGINLGNTMESCGDWINSTDVSAYEKAWGAPITTQNMISGMKKAGFQSIRIPVAWSNMMSTDGKYTINDSYFDRVETIMNYALNEEMYVIMNIHFDGGWWARFGSKDAEERRQAMIKYKAMWTQIANRFREYSDYLIFESANEELGTRLNSVDDYSNSGYFSSIDELYTQTNAINQTFVDVVRSTGGNNSVRHLLIAGYDTNITSTCDARFHMPEDKISNHMMVSVHFYSPATYCIVSDPDNSWGYMDTWGTEKDVAAMRSELSRMKISFVNKGIPVVIGEYGVSDKKVSANQYQRKEGRELFFKSVCDYALNNGMFPCCGMWEQEEHITVLPVGFKMT